MDLSLFAITRANCICNSELQLRFLRDRLLYFDFVVMDLYAEYLLERLCDTTRNVFFSHFHNFLV